MDNDAYDEELRRRHALLRDGPARFADAAYDCQRILRYLRSMQTMDFMNDEMPRAVARSATLALELARGTLLDLSATLSCSSASMMACEAEDEEPDEQGDDPRKDDARFDAPRFAESLTPLEREPEFKFAPPYAKEKRRRPAKKR